MQNPVEATSTGFFWFNEYRIHKYGQREHELPPGQPRPLIKYSAELRECYIDMAAFHVL